MKATSPLQLQAKEPTCWKLQVPAGGCCSLALMCSLFAAGNGCLHIFQWVVRKRFAKYSLLHHHFKNNYSGGTWDGVSRTAFHRSLLQSHLLGQAVFLFSISPRCGNPACVPSMDSSCSKHQRYPECSHLLRLLASTRW